MVWFESLIHASFFLLIKVLFFHWFFIFWLRCFHQTFFQMNKVAFTFTSSKLRDWLNWEKVSRNIYSANSISISMDPITKIPLISWQIWIKSIFEILFWSKFLLNICCRKKMNYLGAFVLVMAILDLHQNRGIEGAPSSTSSKSNEEKFPDCKQINADPIIFNLKKSMCDNMFLSLSSWFLSS